MFMYIKDKISGITASRKALTAVLAALLILCITATGTLMFLSHRTAVVRNAMEPARVTCQVDEDFDGTVKKNVNVKNTSNIDAFLRVRLVGYRVNEAGERIGGMAVVPSFTPGDGWFEKDGFYYYSRPVAPGGFPEADLIGDSGITLSGYSDADGGRQVVEVIAEAIQSLPSGVVAEKWQVAVSADGKTISKGN